MLNHVTWLAAYYFNNTHMMYKTAQTGNVNTLRHHYNAVLYSMDSIITRTPL